MASYVIKEYHHVKVKGVPSSSLTPSQASSPKAPLPTRSGCVSDKSKRKSDQRNRPLITFNYPHLHRQVWAKEYFKAQAKHEDTKFKGDYTQIPRGRVAWNIDKFIVLVGHWAEPILDELTTLIEEEFSLPYFEFVYDEHWDLGHGWSGDM